MRQGDGENRASRGRLSAEAFSRLLDWLDPDREKAGLAYRRLQARLTKLFEYRGCREPEDLVDEVMDRVAAKIEEVAEGYQGDPALFFHGVARNVIHEYYRRQARVEGARAIAPPVPDPPPYTERALQCLDRCLLEELSAEERELILGYYRSEESPKIEGRRRLAFGEGVSAATLRKRTQRLRERLKDCLGRCLGTEG